ncbi:MAG: class II glutamine amidotransferase [Deltaproteobacteria bacterium]|nr:class II glutamine amidotransferase [Deltaproteobacteria bacterium]
MCRLFGFRSLAPSRAHRSLVLAENALHAQADVHTDGWGIGYYLRGEAYVVRSDKPCRDDESFTLISERLASQTFVAHVRKATVGQSNPLNSHPFRHGCWLFAHNGTVFGFDRLVDRILAETAPELRGLALGTTDSERLFYFLLTGLIGGGLCEHGRAAVDEAVASRALRSQVARLCQIAAELGEPPPLLNFILTNGAVFFAHRSGLELFLATQKLSCADAATCPVVDKVCLQSLSPLSAHLAQAGSGAPLRQVNHALVSSEPVGDEHL